MRIFRGSIGRYGGGAGGSGTYRGKYRIRKGRVGVDGGFDGGGGTIRGRGRVGGAGPSGEGCGLGWSCGIVSLLSLLLLPDGVEADTIPST